MFHLGLRKPRANDLEMQIIENTSDPLFQCLFPPPCRGHCLHAGTPCFRYAYLQAGGVRQSCCPAAPPEGGPQGDSDFVQTTRNPAQQAVFKSLGCSYLDFDGSKRYGPAVPVGCQCDLMAVSGSNRRE